MMRILFLGEPLANATQWMKALSSIEGVEVLNWHLPGTSKRERVWQWILSIFRMRSIVNRFNPDVIIGYRTTSYGFLAAWSGVRPCVIAAQGETDVWPPNHWTASLKAMLVRYAVRKSDLVHAWGPNIANTLIRYGAQQKQLLVLPRGVDTSLFSFASEKPTGPLGLISTRSLFPEYNYDIILRALAELKREGILFRYTIVGDGDSKESLKRLASELRLTEEVTFAGRMSNDALPELLRAANVYVAMPETEGVSASLFEAMACGCFPVVPDLPANRLYIKNNDNGLLTDLDEAALTSALRKALGDKFLREKAMYINRKLVETDADLKKNMHSFVDHYKKLIKQKCAE